MVLVSVIINAWNSEAFLSECLETAIVQSLDDIEIIVWDNASSDRTRPIVVECTDKRVRYVYAPEKVSLYESRINAAQEANGQFIAFLDADDLWTIDKLSIQIQAFDDATVAMVASDYLEFSEHENVRTTKLRRTYRGPISSAEKALGAYKVGMSTLMVRTEMALSVWPASPPPYSYLEDFDMVLRLLTRGSLVPIRKPLALRRRHDKNFSLNSFAQINEWQQWITNLGQLDIPQSQIALARAHGLARIRRIVAQENILRGNRVSALWMALKMPTFAEAFKLFFSALLPLGFLIRRWM